MFFATTCVCCGRDGVALCGSCAARLEPAAGLHHDDGALAPGLDSCTALLAYRGSGRDLVLGLKYRNARSLLVPLTAALIDALAAMPPALPIDHGDVRSAFDAVTWAPTSAARRRRRGFDQARLVASGVARRLRLPCRALLRRTTTAAQTGLTRDQRLVGPEFATIPRAMPGRVLLVDDVVTSGATLAAAARALRDGGATAVHGLVVARTPLPHDPTIRDGSHSRDKPLRPITRARQAVPFPPIGDDSMSLSGSQPVSPTVPSHDRLTPTAAAPDHGRPRVLGLTHDFPPGLLEELLRTPDVHGDRLERAREWLRHHNALDDGANQPTCDELAACILLDLRADAAR